MYVYRNPHPYVYGTTPALCCWGAGHHRRVSLAAPAAGRGSAPSSPGQSGDALLWQGIIIAADHKILTMGGEHHFLKEVWSPAGGWWADPKGWKRNTFMVYGAIFLIAAPVAYYSNQQEVRPHAPRRWVPSMMWNSNIPKQES